MPLENFERLEALVTRVLDRHEVLEEENRELKDALGLREAEIEALRERVSRLEGERGRAKEKVDSLLARLDGLLGGS